MTLGLPASVDVKRAQQKRILRPLHIELIKMQRWVIETNQRVLVLFEGRDAAGKGGAIKTIVRHIDPRHYQVVALSKPSERERSQWYLQRYVSHLPAAGELSLFDRSWYNRAGLERVYGLCSEAETEELLRSAPLFEEMLTRSGIRLFKLYFTIDEEQQRRRLEERRDNPLKQWKLSWMDRQAQTRWDDFTRAEEEMLRRTSTHAAPWVRVDANEKWSARINVIRYLLTNLDYPAKEEELLGVDPSIVLPVPPAPDRRQP